MEGLCPPRLVLYEFSALDSYTVPAAQSDYCIENGLRLLRVARRDAFALDR